MQERFRVMLVDDEIFVVSLIQNLIDWEQFGMVVAGTADNGFDALEAVPVLQPDIIIVDVRMPGYDGITFMQKVREINNKVKFIVISGHKRFEYAKSAMQYHVEDYLLKPINKKELEPILLKLKNKLEQERQQEEVLVTMDSQLGVSKKKVRDYLLEELMAGKTQVLSASLPELNKMYLTDFKNGSFLIAIVKLDALDMALDTAFSDNMLARISELFWERLNDLCNDILIKERDGSVLLLLNFTEDMRKEMLLSIEELLFHVQEILIKYEKLSITVGVEEGFASLSDFLKHYAKAQKCIDSRIVLGTGKLITPSMQEEDPGVQQIIFSDESKKSLTDALKSFRSDKIKLQILEAFSRADEYKHQNTLVYQETLYFIHERFYEYLKQIDLYKEEYRELKRELNAGLTWVCTKRQMANALISHIDSYIEEYTEEGKEGENPAVRIAKKYISENYQNSISLALVAEAVNLNSVYFSLLFKREVGINFLDYLNQYRIEVAKKLLKDIRYQINEVAGLAGFQDARYFSKIFKRTIGVTPKEYRTRNVR